MLKTLSWIVCSAVSTGAYAESVQKIVSIDLGGAVVSSESASVQSFDAQGVSQSNNRQTLDLSGQYSAALGLGVTNGHVKALVELLHTESDIDGTESGQLTSTGLYYSMYWMPGVPFVALEGVNLLLGGGVGYVSSALDDDASIDVSDESLSLKVSLGAEYRVLEDLKAYFKTEYIYSDGLEASRSSSDPTVSRVRTNFDSFTTSRVSLGIAYLY